jgi:hypothetical protein
MPYPPRRIHSRAACIPIANHAVLPTLVMSDYETLLSPPAGPIARAQGRPRPLSQLFTKLAVHGPDAFPDLNGTTRGIAGTSAVLRAPCLFLFPVARFVVVRSRPQ